MYTMDQVHTIRELYYNQGLTLKNIAEEVDCDWRTVRKVWASSPTLDLPDSVCC